MNRYRAIAAFIGLLPGWGLSQEVVCGILKASGEDYVVSKETLSIPFTLKSEDPDFAFGCVITDNRNPFSAYYTLEFPKPEELNVNETVSTAEDRERVKIQSAPRMYSGYAYVLLRFDVGDKRGQYSVDVFTNDRPARSVTFDVR